MRTDEWSTAFDPTATASYAEVKVRSRFQIGSLPTARNDSVISYVTEEPPILHVATGGVMPLDPPEDHPRPDVDALGSLVAARGPIAKLVVSPQGTIRWANDRAHGLFGGSVVGGDLASVLVDGDVAPLPGLHPTIPGSAPALVWLRDDDGGQFPALVSALALTPSAAPDLLLTIRPRAPRHPAPARRSDARRVLACEFTPDGMLIRANDAMQAFLGLDRSPVGVRYDQLLDHATGLSGQTARSRQQVLADLSHDLATVGRTPVSYLNGRHVEWTYSRVDDVDGSLLSVIAIGNDVTERVQRAHAQHLNEERFRAILGNINETVIVLAADGTVIETNATSRNALDYDAAFWERTRLIEVLHPDDRAATVATLQDLIESGQYARRTLEARARNAADDYVWAELSGINLIDDDAVGGLLITVRNIDEQRSAQHELERVQAEQRHAVDDRQRFLGAVSHELRNLVHGTLGLSEALDKRAVDPLDRELTGALARQAGTLRRLVDDLLDHTMYTDGRVSFERTGVDVGQLLRDLGDANRAGVRAGVGLYVLPTDPSLALVDGDPHRLRQALQNLIANAINHTSDGAITLAVVAGSRNDVARIEVRDTGSGIDPADRERLFLPYVRGPQERSSGTGLGLTIAKLAAELMGGSIGVLPRDDGTTFWIELPLHDREADDGPNDAHLSPIERIEPMSVLVIDDDPVNLRVATMQLDESVHVVRTVASVSEAIAALRRDHFDVVVCDLHLEGETAFDFLHASIGLTNGDSYLVIMTGDTDPTVGAQLLAAGAQGFLHKPASRQDMERELRRAQTWRRVLQEDMDSSADVG
jgi:PAS domain S-box-containing protein